MSHKTLVLVRHGQSEWNLENIFTGLRDIPLSRQGEEEAMAAGKKLKEYGLHFSSSFVSMLQRSQVTCRYILEALGQLDLNPTSNAALNERDYGALSGLNKDDTRKKWGEEQVRLWRRSYIVAPPEGESLRDVVARVLPYYLYTIQPHILRKENVLIVAHGNSLRALIMALEGISSENIVELELLTAVPIVYVFNDDLTIQSKKILC